MTFLPIVERELRVAARRRSTFWARAAVASGGIVVGVSLYLANLNLPAQQAARRIFYGLVLLSILFCLFAGRRSAADCLSEEKRDGTLGLLFLTDLKGFDIVLGKLAATSYNGFYSLLAVFPVLAVPILMGGIANGEFWRVVLVLADTFLLSLSVGIFVSALSRDARRAMGANLLLLLATIAMPGVCAAALQYFSPSHRFYSQLLLSCPFYSLYLCDDSIYLFSRSSFWWSVTILHGLTWVLLALASWIVRFSWQDEPAGPNRISWRELWRSLNFGPISKRAEYRKRMLDANAFYWLAARARFKPLQVWGVLLCVAGWWVWARMQFGTLWLDESTSGTNVATALMLNVALKLWFGLEACRQLAEDRQAGAFELLLSTPLTVHEVLQGQWLALKRQFFGPALLSAAVAVCFMINAIRHSPDEYGVQLEFWIGAILMFIADVMAMRWTAMHAALTTRNPNQASVLTISRIVILPVVILGAILVLANLYSYLSDTPRPPLSFYVWWWFALGLLADAIYGLTSRRQLLTRFRQLACSEARKSPLQRV